MTSFVLKIIACITMFIDHLSYALFGKISWLNYIGRIAFPIFAFQISEGYLHTKNLKKYFLRLFVFALVSQIPFYLFHSISSSDYALNVLFTLLVGLLCIYLWDKLPNKVLAIFIIVALCILAEETHMDYGYWGVLLVLGFYIFRKYKWSQAVFFISFVLMRYMPYLITYNFYYKYCYLLIGTLTSIVPILLYSGKEGKKVKYLIYLFYPVHLIFLYGLFNILH